MPGDLFCLFKGHGLKFYPTKQSETTKISKTTQMSKASKRNRRNGRNGTSKRNEFFLINGCLISLLITGMLHAR